jgi:hypothetical protein
MYIQLRASWAAEQARSDQRRSQTRRQTTCHTPHATSKVRHPFALRGPTLEPKEQGLNTEHSGDCTSAQQSPCAARPWQSGGPLPRRRRPATASRPPLAGPRPSGRGWRGLVRRRQRRQGSWQYVWFLVRSESAASSSTPTPLFLWGIPHQITLFFTSVLSISGFVRGPRCSKSVTCNP